MGLLLLLPYLVVGIVVLKIYLDIKAGQRYRQEQSERWANIYKSAFEEQKRIYQRLFITGE